MSDHPVFIDRYRVVERIGSGGMGVLYLARDPTIDRRVAIKVAHVQDAELRQRFLREARATGRLDHRNIVTIFDVGEHGGEPFIAMEYVPGRHSRRSSASARRCPFCRACGCCASCATAWRTRTPRGSCIATSSPPT